MHARTLLAQGIHGRANVRLNVFEVALAAFAVAHVGLHEEVSDGYGEFFEDSGIRIVPCVTRVGPEFEVPGERHPNGAAHTRFARCIWQGIEPLLAAATAP